MKTIAFVLVVLSSLNVFARSPEITLEDVCVWQVYNAIEKLNELNGGTRSQLTDDVLNSNANRSLNQLTQQNPTLALSYQATSVVIGNKCIVTNVSANQQY